MSWGNGPSQGTPSWVGRLTQQNIGSLREGVVENTASWPPPAPGGPYEGDSQLQVEEPNGHVVDAAPWPPAQAAPSYDYAPLDEPALPGHSDSYSQDASLNRPHADLDEAISRTGPHEQPPSYDSGVSHDFANHPEPHQHRPEADSSSHHDAHEDNAARPDHLLSHYSEAHDRIEDHPGHGNIPSEDHPTLHEPTHEDHAQQHHTASNSETTAEHRVTTGHHETVHPQDSPNENHLPADYDPQAYNSSEPIDMTTFNYSTLPDPIPSRSSSHLRYLTFTTMLRNQRRWLREWLEFYLMMGVDHFIIYDNNSEDEPLEILQPYIDQGVVTYIVWPPQRIPGPWRPFKTQIEAYQYHWYHDSLETCLDDSWTIHRQGPCQLAAFGDALARSKGGVTRWLACFDVDEYIYPRPNSAFDSIANLLRRQHANIDHLTVHGSVFGTSGHVDHAARRRPGEPLQALMTENYIYRAELARMLNTTR